MLPEIPGGVPTHVAPQEDFGGQRDRACSQEAASGFKEPHTDENAPSQSSLDNIVLLDIEQCAGTVQSRLQRLKRLHAMLSEQFIQLVAQVIVCIQHADDSNLQQLWC